MKKFVLFVTIVLGLGLVAGCLGEDPSPRLDDTQSEEDLHEDADGQAGEESLANASSRGGVDESSVEFPITHSLEGHYAVEAANVGLDDEERALYVPVNEQVGAAVFELKWTGENFFDLYALPPTFCDPGDAPDLLPGSLWSVTCGMLFHAGYEEGSYSATDTGEVPQGQYLRIVLDEATVQGECLDDEDECMWAGFAQPNLAVEASFNMTITLFDGQAPNGYTAFNDVETTSWEAKTSPKVVELS